MKFIEYNRISHKKDECLIVKSLKGTVYNIHKIKVPCSYKRDMFLLFKDSKLVHNTYNKNQVLSYLRHN